MPIPLKATPWKWGEVRLAEHGSNEPDRVVQADDPRLKPSGDGGGGSKIHIITGFPPPSLGSNGEFAVSSDKKGFYVKVSGAWVVLGYLLSSITNSQVTVATPSAGTGTIEVATA
jgi:hypothetical protein